MAMNGVHFSVRFDGRVHAAVRHRAEVQCGPSRSAFRREQRLDWQCAKRSWQCSLTSDTIFHRSKLAPTSDVRAASTHRSGAVGARLQRCAARRFARDGERERGRCHVRRAPIDFARPGGFDKSIVRALRLGWSV